MKKILFPVVTGLAVSALLVGCGESVVKDETAMAEPAMELNNNDFYEAHHEGRIYLFDDYATYAQFQEVGETSFRKVRIGAGPKGETLVFGLTDEDKKKTEGIASIDMYDGKLNGADDFYGEMLTEEGRILVFGSLEEMHHVREVGEAPLRYTDIGGGPNGETVIYVLNNDNKKVKPVEMIEKFKTLHQL